MPTEELHPTTTIAAKRHEVNPSDVDTSKIKTVGGKKLVSTFSPEYARIRTISLQHGFQNFENLRVDGLDANLSNGSPRGGDFLFKDFLDEGPTNDCFSLAIIVEMNLILFCTQLAVQLLCMKRLLNLTLWIGTPQLTVPFVQSVFKLFIGVHDIARNLREKSCEILSYGCHLETSSARSLDG